MRQSGNNDVIPRDTLVEVERMIKALLSSSIKDAEKMASSEAMSVMTITKMFEQMREDTAEGGGGEGGDDSDEEPQTHFYKKKPKTPALTSKTTIIDVLENSDYDREQKVNFIDTAMVSMFPALEGDKVTFIGSTFMKYGESEPYMNHCLVLGTCDPVHNVVIESTDNERDLLLKWTELIQQENPDIIIGYNIFGFDYEFMFRRAEENR